MSSTTQPAVLLSLGLRVLPCQSTNAAVTTDITPQCHCHEARVNNAVTQPILKKVTVIRLLFCYCNPSLYSYLIKLNQIRLQ